MTIQQIVARRLKLFTRRRVVSMLDGNYDSIFKGKGIELDSLRPYDRGDNIRDIDWRSTARTGMTHTKLYAPLRDQRIVIVADTTPSMLLDSHTGMNKRDAVYGLIVALGMFVRKNRDLLALCHVKPDGAVGLSRFSNTNNHIEKLLRSYDGDVQAARPGKTVGLAAQLQSVLHNVRARSAIFVVTDMLPEQASIKPYLTKLSSRHQVFWLQLPPSSPHTDVADPLRQGVDIETLQAVSEDIMLNKKLANQWQEMVTANLGIHAKTCRSTGTAFGVLHEAEALPEELRNMFTQARRYARRH